MNLDAVLRELHAEHARIVRLIKQLEKQQQQSAKLRRRPAVKGSLLSWPARAASVR